MIDVLLIISCVMYFILGFAIANIFFHRKIRKILKVIGKQIEMVKDIEDENERKIIYSKIEGEQQVISELLKKFIIY